MHIALSLVGIIFLGVQCHSRGVPSENDRQYRIETFYQPTDRRNLKQERVLQQVPRATRQQQERETNEPQQTQFEAVYVKNSTPSRPKRGKKLPKIEQYLKEVTPTTKTTYNPIIFKAETQLLPLYEQYVKESSKPVPIAQNILAIHNAILARENAIYEQKRADQLQRQIGAKPYSEPIENYEVTKPEEEIDYYPNNNEYNEEAEEEDDDESEDRHSESEDEKEEHSPPAQKPQKTKEPSPEREIVYYHNVEYGRETGSKYPVSKFSADKKQLPKEAPAEEEDEEEEEEDDDPNEEENEYNQKDEYNQEPQREEKYGEREPAPPKYQAKLSKSPKLILPTEAGLEHLYQPVTHSSPIYPKEKQSSKKPKEQIYVSDVKFEKNVVYKPGQPKEEVSYYVDPSDVQYQLEQAGSTNYITDQNKLHYPQVQQIPAEQNYQKYRTNVAKYHEVPSHKASKPRERVVTHYVLVPQPVRSINQESYQSQQYAPSQLQQVQQKDPSQEDSSYLGPSDEDYRQSELKQKLGRNSSLRILKTGKPVVFIGHEE